MGSGLTRTGFLTGGLTMLATPLWASTPQSRIDRQTVVTSHFAHNKIGIAEGRDITVYLPAGYDTNRKYYPVIYYLPNLFDDHQSLYTRDGAQAIFDQAIATGVIKDTIVVCADFSTPLGSSLFVNSSVTGNWEDFLVRSLIHYIDNSYRTLAGSASRGIAGDRMGGHGAIRVAMKYPDLFSAVYALHPVGTGGGVQTMHSRPNWDLLGKATSLDDLKADGFSMVFTAIYQAHLPNPDRAPLFVDLPARQVDGRLVIDSALTTRLQDSFLLERLIPQYADNLKRLNGFKFDWGRNDTVFDHISSNQAFAHKLDEYGIAYEAEEYRGGFGDRHWGKDGRVMSDMLPFFARTLTFV